VNVLFQLADPSGLMSVDVVLQMFSREFPILKCLHPELIIPFSNSTFTYNASCKIPVSDFLSGQYTLRISAQDNLNNYLTTQLGTFQVAGDLEASDFAVPMLVSSSISPSTVSLGGTVIVTFELSGRAVMREVSVSFFYQNERPLSLCQNEGVLHRVFSNMSVASYVFTCNITSNSTGSATVSEKISGSSDATNSVSWTILLGRYRVALLARDIMDNTIFSTLGNFYLTSVPLPPAVPVPASTATSTSPTAVVLTVFSDGACATPVASIFDSPNPIVAYLDQCIKSTNTTYYYKPTSCVMGGKFERIVYTDSACTVRAVEEIISADTDKCVPSANGRFEKFTCAIVPMADNSAKWLEPVSQRLRLSFRTSHICASNDVTRGCLLKNMSFASGT
jgi:hypothetical protein